ncbi:MAG: ABC transporter ATP-binding protein, partial [Pseudomonadota bacterium]
TGFQIAETLRVHGEGAADARARTIATLADVGCPDPERVFRAYPFELSGGMCQRIVIALALACDPRLLIADEPTTGLDITTQKAVMELVRDLIAERGMSAILITHDLGLAAQYCERIAVMKDGKIVETGPSLEVFATPQHPYTRRLVDATPREGASVRALLPAEARAPEPAHTVGETPLLAVTNLTKTFDGKAGPVHAVRGISFDVREGETLGLVGESGCGKSTTSAMIVRLLDPSSGAIVFGGENLAKTPAKTFARDPRRAAIQMVFQDATDSLNPRHSAERAIAEPLLRLARMKGAERRNRVRELADLVGLPAHLLDRFPHQLSGGQKARVGIARALALNPRFLVLDEPTAALDVSIQAVVLNLLCDLRAQLGISYLFVSHDLQVVRLLCDRVVVMREGVIVEAGETARVMDAPADAYTADLIAAAPKPPVRDPART